jgi:hypothetical protein
VTARVGRSVARTTAAEALWASSSITLADPPAGFTKRFRLPVVRSNDLDADLRLGQRPRHQPEMTVGSARPSISRSATTGGPFSVDAKRGRLPSAADVPGRLRPVIRPGERHPHCESDLRGGNRRAPRRRRCRSIRSVASAANAREPQT